MAKKIQSHHKTGSVAALGAPISCESNYTKCKKGFDAYYDTSNLERHAIYPKLKLLEKIADALWRESEVIYRILIKEPEASTKSFVIELDTLNTIKKKTIELPLVTKQVLSRFNDQFKNLQKFNEQCK